MVILHLVVIAIGKCAWHFHVRGNRISRRTSESNPTWHLPRHLKGLLQMHGQPARAEVTVLCDYETNLKQ